MAFDRRIVVRQFELKTVSNPGSTEGLVEQWVLWSELLEEVGEATPFSATVLEPVPDSDLSRERLAQFVTLTYSKVWRVRWDRALAVALRRTFPEPDQRLPEQDFDAPIFVLDDDLAAPPGEAAVAWQVAAIIEEPELGRRRNLRIVSASGRQLQSD